MPGTILKPARVFMLRILKFQLLFLFLLAFAASGNTKIGKAKSTYCTNIPLGESPATIQQDDPITFLRHFFKWYKTKYDYLDHHMYLVDIDLKHPKPYRINFKKTEEYLSILKSSGFFSDSYINHKRAFFKKIDLTLQKTKQNDGTVDGLDYDPIVYSQEPESILGNLNDIQLKIVKSTISVVIVKTQTQFDVNRYLLYNLTKEGANDRIEKIDDVTDGKIANPEQI